MRIAVSARGGSRKDEIESRFGRCQNFIIHDSGTGEDKVLKNPGLDSSGGAGIQAARMLVDYGIDAVLVDRLGPKAYKVFEAAGVGMYQGIHGTVENSLTLFTNGKLNAMDKANAHMNEKAR